MSLINPRVDIAFKKIFGVEENKDMLMSLLNSIISEEDQIDDIELLNPYNERNFKKDKLSVLDIKARNKASQTYFLIEMQLAEEMDYAKRGLFSWARVYSNQIGSGDQYKKLNKTIAIHILNFTFINYKKTKGWTEFAPHKYHHRFVLSDKDTGIEIFHDLEIHTIELSKFDAIDDDDLNEVMSKVKDMLDTWLVILTKYDLLDAKNLPEKINKPEIRKSLKVMQEMNLSATEREIYNSHLDFLRMEYGALESRFEAGKAEGIQEGIEKGKAEGKAEGELKTKLEIAKNLIAKGFDDKTIFELTGLSLAEIKKYTKKTIKG